MNQSYSKHPSFHGLEVLNKENWDLVNKRYVAKSISELMHEVLFDAERARNFS